MPRFGKSSMEKLSTVHPNLQKVLMRVIGWYNFTILEGHRGQEAQDEAFRTGRSKVKYPDSKHNAEPSEAVDIAPWPVIWPSKEMSREERRKVFGRFYVLAGAMFQAAYDLDIFIRWGGDWDQDWDIIEDQWDDFPHFGLLRR